MLSLYCNLPGVFQLSQFIIEIRISCIAAIHATHINARHTVNLIEVVRVQNKMISEQLF